MTGEQKQTILRHRAEGMVYSQIADIVGLPLNTVKSHCRHTGLSESNASEETGIEENKDHCKHCGKKLRHTPKAKPKKFCGDKCRRAWWNVHRDQLKRQALYPMVCVRCGKDFESYGNASRKYCSHSCYISHRFGEVATA